MLVFSEFRHFYPEISLQQGLHCSNRSTSMDRLTGQTDRQTDHSTPCCACARGNKGYAPLCTAFGSSPAYKRTPLSKILDPPLDSVHLMMKCTRTHNFCWGQCLCITQPNPWLLTACMKGIPFPPQLALVPPATCAYLAAAGQVKRFSIAVFCLQWNIGECLLGE